MLRANIFMKKFIFLFAFNVYKGINIFILQIFAFVYNSLISVMPYKVYNELPGVGTTAKTLISVIYYNVCNVIEWRHQYGQMVHGCNLVRLYRPVCTSTGKGALV